MNKFLFSAVTAATLLGVAVPVVHAAAATESNGFSVDVTLVSKCLATPATLRPSLAFNYESFQTSASTAPAISLSFKCTRGIAAPSLAFDTASGLATGEGVAGGLRYTLAIGADTGVAGTAASNADGGSEKTLVYSITGSIAAGQAGDAAALPQQVRSLIVTY